MATFRKLLISASALWLGVSAAHAQLPDYLAPPAISTSTPNQSNLEDRNGSALFGSPLLDAPPAVPGWFGAVDVGIVVPHIKNGLFNTVTREKSGVTDNLQLPSVQPGVLAMPNFEFGYRFGEAAGEIVLSYRFLVGHQTQMVPGEVVPAYAPAGVPITSRLDLQVITLDYGSSEPRTVLGVDMTWRIGLRGLIYFADSQADNGTLFQQSSDSYWGLGPHAMVDFRRRIGASDFSLFGRLDAAFVFGQLNQRFSESVTAGGVVDYGQTRTNIDSQVTSLGAQAGVAWTPQWNRNIAVTAGYVFEHYFDVGTINTPPSAREELYLQGGFIRFEWRY